MKRPSELDSSIAWSSNHGDLHAVDVVESVGVLCGSFDPLHAGHLQLNRVAASRLRTAVVYEMSMQNVDKADLDWDQVENRLTQQFNERLIVTRAATFQQKCRVFRDCRFVIGVDTAERLVDVRYYGQSARQRDVALEEIAEHGNQFLVAGRFCSTRKEFVPLDQVAIPSPFRSLFDGLSESDFRKDLTSTELRQSSEGES